MFKLTAYQQLTDITKIQKPYRMSTNRYPLYHRTQNTKYFLAQERNDAIEYDIVYGVRHVWEELTEEEFNLEKLENPNDKTLKWYQIPQYKLKNDGVTREFGRFSQQLNVLGTVYPDNTFKFVKDSYNQGDRLLLNNMLKCELCLDTRRGGMTYQKWHSSTEFVFHPIYKNFILDLSTSDAVVPYEVTSFKVNRKESKKLLQKYEDFFKVTEVMCKAITPEMFSQTGVEIFAEIRQNTAEENYLLAELLVNTSPMDALFTYAAAFKVRAIYHLEYYSGNRNAELSPDEVFQAVKRNLKDRLYKANPQIFKTVSHPMGGRYPPSVWGNRVHIADSSGSFSVEVQQC
jgi:hypothetical protein